MASDLERSREARRESGRPIVSLDVSTQQFSIGGEPASALEVSRESRTAGGVTFSSRDIETGDINVSGQRLTGSAKERREQFLSIQSKEKILSGGRLSPLEVSRLSAVDRAEVIKFRSEKFAEEIETDLGRKLTEAEFKEVFSISSDLNVSDIKFKIKQIQKREVNQEILERQRERTAKRDITPTGIFKDVSRAKEPDFFETLFAPARDVAVGFEKGVRAVGSGLAQLTFPIFTGVQLQKEFADQLAKAVRTGDPSQLVFTSPGESFQRMFFPEPGVKRRIEEAQATGFELATIITPVGAGATLPAKVLPFLITGRRGVSLLTAETPAEFVVEAGLGGLIGGVSKLAKPVSEFIQPKLFIPELIRGTQIAGKALEKTIVPAFFTLLGVQALQEISPSLAAGDFEKFEAESIRTAGGFSAFITGAEFGGAATSKLLSEGAFALRGLKGTGFLIRDLTRPKIETDIAFFESLRIKKGETPAKVKRPARLQLEEGLGIFERIGEPKVSKITRPARLQLEEGLGIFERIGEPKISKPKSPARLGLEEGLGVFGRDAGIKTKPKPPVRVEFIQEGDVSLIQRQIIKKGRGTTPFPRTPLKFEPAKVKEAKRIKPRTRTEQILEGPTTKTKVTPTRDVFQRDFRRRTRTEEITETFPVFAEGFEPSFALAPELRQPEIAETRLRLADVSLPIQRPIEKAIPVAVELALPKLQPITQPRIETLVREIPVTQEIIRDITVPVTVTPEIEKEIEKTFTLEKLKPRSTPKIIEKTFEEFIPKETPKIRVPPPPTGLLPIVLKEERVTRKVKKIPGYHTEVKSEGKWLRVEGVRTRKRALGLGAQTIDNSASASFRIRKANKTIAPVPDNRIWDALKSKFRRQKRGKSIVEKNTFRIDSFGELQGITAKGLLALRNLRASGVKIKRKKRKRRK